MRFTGCLPFRRTVGKHLFPALLLLIGFAMSGTVGRGQETVPNRSPLPTPSDRDPRQDGDAAIIPLPFYADHLQLNQTGKQVLVWKIEGKQSKICCFDVETLKLTGQLEFPDAVEYSMSVDRYFLLIHWRNMIEDPTVKVTVVDEQLRILGVRGFKEWVNYPPILDGCIKLDTTLYSLPTLEKRPETVPRLRGRYRCDSGPIVNGFLVDESSQKPLWFLGAHELADRPQTSFEPMTIPHSKCPKAGQMVKLVSSDPTETRLWEWSLTKPEMSFDEWSKGIDAGLRFAISSKSAKQAWMNGWARLQAEYQGTILGRIRFELPDNLTVLRPEAHMSANRDRVAVILGKNLVIFRVIPERANDWDKQATLDFANAPIHIPSDTVTQWLLKLNDGREINDVICSHNWLRWNSNSHQLTIDSPAYVKDYGFKRVVETIFRSTLVKEETTLEEAIAKINSAADNSIAVAITSLSGQVPKGFLQLVPIQFDVRMNNAPGFRLHGGVFAEIDLKYLEAEFANAQSQRPAKALYPSLDTLPDLTIVQSPEPPKETAKPPLKTKSVPLFNLPLLAWYLGNVLAIILFGTLSLYMSSWILNLISHKEDRIPFRSTDATLVVVSTLGMLLTSMSCAHGATYDLFLVHHNFGFWTLLCLFGLLLFADFVVVIGIFTLLLSVRVEQATILSMLWMFFLLLFSVLVLTPVVVILWLLIPDWFR